MRCAKIAGRPALAFIIASIIAFTIALSACSTDSVRIGNAAPSSDTVAALGLSGKLKTVFVIVMENHNWSDIKGSTSAPYLNGTLLAQGAHAEQYFNAPNIHPSEPNYLWMEAGTNFGVKNDSDPKSNHQSTTSHLTAELEAAGISWKSYQENINGTTCPLRTSGLYAPKHNPMVFFDDMTDNLSASSPHCIAHVRPYTELATDLNAGSVAAYNFITPNLCDDMHNPTGCDSSDEVQNGDDWLARNVPVILASKAYQDAGALFITWDESEGGEFPIGMIVLSPHAKAGYQNQVHYTHSSFLRTMQEIFGVSPLLGDAKNAASLSDLFDLQTTPDLVPPTCTITAPAANAALSGVVSFTAAASDDTGVAKVEFQVDDQTVGSVTQAPYAAAWDTKNATLGAHTVRCQASDAAGNVGTSDQVTFTVDTPPVPPPGSTLRVVEGNLSSGTDQSYDSGEGARIFAGLKPDLVLVQELNVGDDSDPALRAFVDANFGTSFQYYREAAALPNGVVSRYPILASGSWTDPKVGNRGFVWAKIDVPGPVDLWAVSLHLLTTGSLNRDAEAQALVALMASNIPPGDFVVIGGDLNTGSRSEPCLATLAAVVQTAGPYPADQQGNTDTSENRNKPHDWLLENTALEAQRVPVTVGAQSFPAGLVLDTRVYSPLSDLPPALATDSGAVGMQHMAVVKDFAF